MSVQEAIAVLEEASKTPRARAAFSLLQAELQESADTKDFKASGESEKPRFPSEKDVVEHFDGDSDSAKGSHSDTVAKGQATARKGQ